MSDLDGNYRVFRPAWTIKGMEKERVMMSRMQISTSGGFTRYTEEQNFTDPDAKNIVIDEADDGAVFYLGGNIVLLGLTRGTQGLKLYTASSLFPVLGDGSPVKRLRGTMMAVVGEGPHGSYPFVAYRSNEAFEEIETEIVNAEDKKVPPDVLDALRVDTAQN